MAAVYPPFFLIGCGAYVKNVPAKNCSQIVSGYSHPSRIEHHRSQARSFWLESSLHKHRSQLRRREDLSSRRMVQKRSQCWRLARHDGRCFRFHFLKFVDGT